MTDSSEARIKERWWQTDSPKSFCQKIKLLDSYGLRTLSAEIAGSLAFIDGQIAASNPNANPDWWRRANLARGFIAEKHAFVAAELARRHERGEGKLRMALSADLRRLAVALDDEASPKEVKVIVRDMLRLLQQYFGAAADP